MSKQKIINLLNQETFSCAPSEGQLTKRVKILSN